MKSLSLSLVMALAGITMGHAATVWSYDKPTGNDVQPETNWFSFAQGGSTSGSLVDTQEGYKQFTVALDLNSSDYSTAGFGFVWKYANGGDVPTDLSKYSGLCFTYKADRPFRVD